MKGNVATRVEVALREEEPETALRDVVRALLAEGYSRAELVAALERYRTEPPAELSSRRRDQGDELVLDVMAVLDGWASTIAVRNLLPPPCEAPHASRLD